MGDGGPHSAARRCISPPISLRRTSSHFEVVAPRRADAADLLHARHTGASASHRSSRRPFESGLSRRPVRTTRSPSERHPDWQTFEGTRRRSAARRPGDSCRRSPSATIHLLRYQSTVRASLLRIVARGLECGPFGDGRRFRSRGCRGPATLSGSSAGGRSCGNSQRRAPK